MLVLNKMILTSYMLLVCSYIQIFIMSLKSLTFLRNYIRIKVKIITINVLQIPQYSEDFIISKISVKHHWSNKTTHFYSHIDEICVKTLDQ